MGGDGFPNDIALLKLKGKANLTDYVNVIALAAADATDDFTNCMITGWGATRLSK